MPDGNEEDFSSHTTDSAHRRFQVTVYRGGLKMVGIVYHSADTRSSSRRASDFIHSVNQERLTLSSPRIFERTTNLVIDEPPFVVINMARIDAMHAEELEME